MSGMIEASMTRSPLTPWTVPTGSTTACGRARDNRHGGCGGRRWPEASHRDRHSYQSAESRAHFGDELARSLVGGEMATPLRRTVVPQIRVTGPRPALGHGDVIRWKARVRTRRGHFIEAPHTRRERMPVQAGRGGRRRVQPVDHHVVEQLVLGKGALNVLPAV